MERRCCEDEEGMKKRKKNGRGRNESVPDGESATRDVPNNHFALKSNKIYRCSFDTSR
jgi:hypothetical protein